MAGNFFYPTHWREIADDIRPDLELDENTGVILGGKSGLLGDRAVAELETRDRYLEDYLNNLGSGTDVDKVPYVIDVKIDYGAKGDLQATYDASATAGNTLVTSASASFTASDQGKVCALEFADASGRIFVSTIASVVSSTQVHMAAAPGSNVTIASFYWGTDDCVAIQNAINAAVVGSQLRGGALSTILFPPGGYMIYNANGLTNNVWHSVLHTTRAAAYPLGSASIQFLGFGSVGVPAGWYVNGVTVGWTPTFNGSVLYCPYNAYDGLNPGTGNVPSFFACDDFAGNGFQDIYVKIKDITLRTPTPTGLSGFDLSHASVAEVDGLIVDVDYVTPQDMTSIITGTAVGLIMPRVDNGAYSNIRTYACIGQYVGILGGEHTHIDYAVIFKCERGLQVNAPQNHMVTFDHLGVFHCHWALVAGGTGTAVLSGKLNVERDTLAPQAFQYDVYDPNNNFYGNVQYLSVTTGTGARNAATVNSAANLTLVRLA